MIEFISNVIYGNWRCNHGNTDTGNDGGAISKENIIF